MKPRAAVLLAALVLAACGSSHSATTSSSLPPRLPVGGGAQATLAPIHPTVYDPAQGLPSLDGTARAHHVTVAIPTTAGSLADGSVSTGVACSPEGACPTTTRPPDLPAQDEARSIGVDALKRAGVDVDGAVVSVDDGGTTWTVRVDPVVDAVPTERMGSVAVVGPGGAVVGTSVYGGTIDPRDEYPLLGTAEAIARLNRGEGFLGPQPLLARGVPAPATIPADVGSDGTTTTVVDHVAVTGAERILVLVPSVEPGNGNDGWLVPAYRFTLGTGGTVTVSAIDASFLGPGG